MTQVRQIVVNQLDNGFTITVNAHNPRENKQLVAIDDAEVRKTLHKLADEFTSAQTEPKK